MHTTNLARVVKNRKRSQTKNFQKEILFLKIIFIKPAIEAPNVFVKYSELFSLYPAKLFYAVFLLQSYSPGIFRKGAFIDSSVAKIIKSKKKLYHFNQADKV